jgi:lysophospholipase L1-like esterase
VGGVAFLNSEDAKIGSYKPEDYAVSVPVDGKYYASYPVPSNASYLIATTKLGTAFDVSNSIYILPEERFYTTSPAYYEMNDVGFSDNYARAQIKTLGKSSLDYSDLTWALIGDSLTHKNERANTSYYDYISNATGINFVNKALSGRGYVSTNYYFKTEVQQLVNEQAQFDFCTMFGSGNDLSESNWPSAITATDFDEALGTASDSGNDTICGAINQTIDLFLDNFPTKKLGLVTPTPWEEYCTPSGTLDGTRMDKYSNKIVEICRRRGIPCLDLYHTSGMRPWDADYRAEFFVENGVIDTPATHPNSKGHKWIAPMFLRFIQRSLIDKI